MGVCHAYTKSLRRCRGLPGGKRVCRVHRDWYTKRKWLSLILKNISILSNFNTIRNILTDPFARYYKDASIPSLELYIDTLYEIGPQEVRHRIRLLYDIACRCGRIQPSMAPNLWHHYITINIGTALTYNELFRDTFDPPELSSVIINAIIPYIRDESFEVFVIFIGFMLNNNLDETILKLCIKISLPYINQLSWSLHEKEFYLLEVEKDLSFRKSYRQVELVKSVFAYLRTLLHETAKTIPERLPMHDELIATVLSPEAIMKVIGKYGHQGLESI
jgi:hypothetical protein